MPSHEAPRFSEENTDVRARLLSVAESLSEQAKSAHDIPGYTEIGYFIGSVAIIHLIRSSVERTLGLNTKTVLLLNLHTDDPFRKVHRLLDNLEVDHCHFQYLLDLKAFHWGYIDSKHLDPRDRLDALLSIHDLTEQDISEPVFNWSEVLLRRSSVRNESKFLLQTGDNYEAFISYRIS